MRISDFQSPIGHDTDNHIAICGETILSPFEAVVVDNANTDTPSPQIDSQSIVRGDAQIKSEPEQVSVYLVSFILFKQP